MTRNQHRNTFNTILRKQEERSIGGVYMALRKQYIRFINNFKQYGKSYAINNMGLELFNSEMGKAVEKIYISAGLFMANRTLSMLNKIKQPLPPPTKEERNEQRLEAWVNMLGNVDVKKSNWYAKKYLTFGYNDEWIQQIINYFQRHLLEKAVIKVSNTTRDQILSVLDKATREGWSNQQIVDALSNLDEIRRRARKIVRTETVRAANYGTMLGADKYDFEVVKEWVSVMDNRVRHTHAANDKERRETDAPFSNGLLFPGDPNGPAEETINCRCSMVMVAKRDQRGRLIPKKTQMAA